jgi:diguanylate cyclase
MFNVDPTTVRAAIENLEKAMLDHAAWQENLVRAIVRGFPLKLGEFSRSARLHGQFSRWYYEQAPAELWGQPAFAAIGVEHDRLHRIAARLLRGVAAGAPIIRRDFEEFTAGSARLRRQLDSLRLALRGALRNRDALTGAYDRAGALPDLREEHELARRRVQPCCIVFMDLDHLKEVNDTHGRAAGDAVLAGSVRHLRNYLRPDDKVYRYGDDEFLVALPGTDLPIGQAVINRVREGFAGNPLVVDPGGATLHATASFGLASLDPEVGVEESIERADQALLLAKTAGRNRAISWDPSVTTGKWLPRLRAEDVKV